MLRTVKNLADELGVEKFRIYKFIRDNNLRVTHLGSSRIMYFDDREAAKIIRAFTPETFEPDEEDLIAIGGRQMSGYAAENPNSGSDEPDDYELSDPQVSAEQEALRAERMVIHGFEEFAAIIDDTDEDAVYEEDDISEIIESENEDAAPEVCTVSYDEAEFDDDDDFIDDMLTFIFDGEECDDNEEIAGHVPDTVSVQNRIDVNETVRSMAELIHSQEDLIKNLKAELQSRDDHIEAVNGQLSNMTGALRNANDCIKRLSEGTRNLTESLKASQALYMSAVQSLSEEQEERRILEERLCEITGSCEDAAGDQEAADDYAGESESVSGVPDNKAENISPGSAFGNLGKRLRGYFSGRR